jgi:hypothetical protein
MPTVEFGSVLLLISGICLGYFAVRFFSCIQGLQAYENIDIDFGVYLLTCIVVGTVCL